MIVNAAGSSLGEAVPGDPYIDHREALANAWLWAAAPDLYLALERLLEWFHEEDGARDLCDAARAALAKARGEV